MIGQNSNNKATGYTAKECDAGIPISGRTGDTGVYEILKLNADGSVPVTGGASPVPLTPPSTPSSSSTYAVSPPGGAVAAGIFGFFTPVTILTAPTSGLYRINPFVAFGGAGGGALNIALVDENSNLFNYCVTLTPFTDVFAPTTFNISTGLTAFWHNNTAQQFGTGVQIAYNRSNVIDTYVNNVNQWLLVWVDSAITTIPGTSFQYGFYEFAKIS